MNSIPESEKDTKNPDSPILYRPKPKRLCISYNQVINKNSHKKHFALSPTANEPKNKKPKLNFDEISLKENIKIKRPKNPFLKNLE